MIVDEEEASELFCPYRECKQEVMCEGRDCMAWRWYDKCYEDGTSLGPDRRGYCGLSGEPGRGEI